MYGGGDGGSCAHGGFTSGYHVLDHGYTFFTTRHVLLDLYPVGLFLRYHFNFFVNFKDGLASRFLGFLVGHDFFLNVLFYLFDGLLNLFYTFFKFNKVKGETSTWGIFIRVFFYRFFRPGLYFLQGRVVQGPTTE